MILKPYLEDFTVVDICVKIVLMKYARTFIDPKTKRYFVHLLKLYAIKISNAWQSIWNALKIFTKIIVNQT